MKAWTIGLELFLSTAALSENQRPYSHEKLLTAQPSSIEQWLKAECPPGRAMRQCFSGGLPQCLPVTWTCCIIREPGIGGWQWCKGECPPLGARCTIED